LEVTRLNRVNPEVDLRERAEKHEQHPKAETDDR
jgi:hypothetical protein